MRMLISANRDAPVLICRVIGHFRIALMGCLALNTSKTFPFLGVFPYDLHSPVALSVNFLPFNLHPSTAIHQVTEYIHERLLNRPQWPPLRPSQARYPIQMVGETSEC